MGKKKGGGNGGGGGEDKNKASPEEGHNLLGEPTFKLLENGRYKCVETGHELPAHSRDSYAQSKHCRLGLIDSALARKKPPLNMFRQDPESRSKLICKLTGDTVNKSEEHIWKHINGRRFLNMLEKKEAEQLQPNLTVEEMIEEKEEKKRKKKDDKLKKKKKNKQEKDASEIISEARDPNSGKDSDMEEEDEEADFWMPPVGERWDFDEGGDRWGSDSEIEQEDEEADSEGITDKDTPEAGELSTRTKRMSLEIGPSSFASRKKKKKITET